MDFSLKACRKRLSIRKNEQRLRRELDRYEAAFEERELAIPDDAAIRGLLKDRFPLMQAKPKGAL